MSWWIIAGLWLVALVAVRAIVPSAKGKKAVTGLFVFVPIGLFFHYRATPGDTRRLVDAIIIGMVGLGVIAYLVRVPWPRKALQVVWVAGGMAYYEWAFDDSDGALKHSLSKVAAFGPVAWIILAVLVVLIIAAVAAADRGIDRAGERAKATLTGRGKTP
jgi:hypothetical protein